MSKFDRAIKEVMQRIFLHSSLSWLGLDLKDAVFEEVPLNIFQAQDREVDFLRIVSYPNRASFYFAYRVSDAGRSKNALSYGRIQSHASTSI